ncbi:MAG: GGDEF domain-containing response regulator [Gemmatimonadales bacterium]
MLQTGLLDALEVHDLLLIEDNPDDVLILELLLSELPGVPIVVRRAASAAEGIALALAAAPEVILTDLSLPDATGLDIISRLRVAVPQVPVVVLTGSHDTTLGVAAVRSGAQDFLVKGETDVNALGRSLRHAVERHRLLQELNALRALEVHRATHDLLTGLPNRSLFLDRLDHLLARARRREEPFAVAYLDLDGFKAVNDRLGHQAGDAALMQVANRFADRVRKSDTLARLGGDEFVVLFEGLGDRATVLALVEGIRGTLAVPIPIGDAHALLGVSVGVALYPEDGTDAATLVGAADAAMYRDKATRQGALCGRP